MKILLITNGYPPHRWAGTETYTAGLAEILKSRGHRVSVLCVGKWDEGPSHFNGSAGEEYHGVAVDRLNFNWTKAADPFRSLYDNPLTAQYLGQVIRENKPDLVHVTSCETLSASILPVIKQAGIPCVLTLTDFWFLCPRINLLKDDGSVCDGQTTAWQCLKCQASQSKIYRWPRRFLPESTVASVLTGISKHPAITRQRGLRGLVGDMQRRKDFLAQAIQLADVRITASAFVRDLYQKNGMSPILVRPYGHDLTWLKDFSGKTTSPNLRIGYIGQISHVKGIHILLEAFNKLDRRYQEKISISIYGNLEHNIQYSSRLKALANGNKSIQFCGIYPHEKSGSVFANLDVLVVPSVWFDFPLIIYEAFATGTPVIASNLGGMAEAVSHDHNGLLFESGNSQDLGKQIERCLEETDLLAKLREGITPVKTMEAHIDELEEIYHQVQLQTN
jgi:glycosyltransferase involved in cell wall biosynthesis